MKKFICFIPFCLALFGQKEFVSNTTAGTITNRTYYNTGLSDDVDHQTKMVIFNPTGNTVSFTATAWDQDGLLAPILPAGVSQVIGNMGPWETLEMITDTTGTGRQAAMVSIEMGTTATIPIWQTELKGSDVRSTSPFSSYLQFAHYFPYAPIATGPARVEDSEEKKRIAGLNTMVGISNVRPFSDTVILSLMDSAGSLLWETSVDLESYTSIFSPLGDLFSEASPGDYQLRMLSSTGYSSGYLSLDNDQGFAKVNSVGGGSNTSWQSMIHDPGQGIAQTMFVMRTFSSTPVVPQEVYQDFIQEDNSVTTVTLPNAPYHTVIQSPSQDFFTVPPADDARGFVKTFDSYGTSSSLSVIHHTESHAAVEATNNIYTMRAVFPIDPDINWLTDLADSELLIYSDAYSEQTPLLNLAWLNEVGTILAFDSIELPNNVTRFNIGDLVGNLPDTHMMLMEFNFAAEVRADVQVSGLNNQHKRVLDQIQVQRLDGALTIGNYPLLLSAWADGSPTCMGTQLSITDLVTYLNNGYTCF